MCDKELLVSYLYDELQDGERREFERHLASCEECRGEVHGLRATRTHLASWASAEPELGLQIVRRTAPATSPRLRIAPAWGLAAAAVLVLAVAAAIANVEVRAGGEGLVIRTGWHNPAQPSTAVNQVAADDQVQAAAVDFEAIHSRLREIEAMIAERPATTAPLPAAVSDAARADLLRQFRRLIEQSEARQQRELAIRIGQVARDVDNARRADFAQIQQGIAQIQGRANETFIRQQRMESAIYRAVQLQER